MAFSYSVIKDGDRYVEVKCTNTGGAAGPEKIIDASTLNFSKQLDTELLKLVSFFVSADQDTKVYGRIFWADAAGAVTTDPAVIFGNGLNGQNKLFVENDYPNSNGDVYFQADASTYTMILTFQKVRGFYSSTAKPWSE